MKSHLYRPDIDGLRGVAVFAVVAFHAQLPFFSGGFVGVDIFFVISGFLISSIIQRDIAAGTFRFGAFYARRARRILPALLTVLLCCSALGGLMLTGAELRDLSRSALATVGAVSNLYFWHSSGYFSAVAEMKPLLMTWSLGVEEQFYLFFPLLLLALRRLRCPVLPALLTLTALSCAACVWVTGRNPASAFYLLPTRAWELGAGALLAVRQTRTGTRSASCRAGRHVENGMGLAGAALLATSLLCFNRGTAFPGGAALLPVAGAALLIVAPGSAVNRHLLSWRPLVFVGLVSYSWYLWHWPLLAFARLTDNRTLPTPTALALVALAFLLAVLSWWLIERPFRRSRGGAASTLWRYGAASMAMLALGAGGLYGAAWPQRLPPALAAIERSSAHAPDACLAPYGAAAPERSPLCSPTADQPALAILGDSHAAALTPALRTWAVRHRLALHAYTKSSCPALSGVTRWMPERPRHASECARYNEQVLQLVGASDAIRVVVLAGYWSAPYDDARQGQRYVRTGGAGGKVGPVTPADGDELADGLAATIRRLQLAGKKVVLVQDVPMFDFDPVRTVATAWIPARRTVATLLGLPASGPVFHAAARQVRNSADRSRTLINSIGGADARITVLDPWTSLCQDKQCFYGDGRQLYYTDAQHLNEAGAGLLLQTSDGAALLP